MVAQAAIMAHLNRAGEEVRGAKGLVERVHGLGRRHHTHTGIFHQRHQLLTHHSLVVAELRRCGGVDCPRVLQYLTRTLADVCEHGGVSLRSQSQQRRAHALIGLYALSVHGVASSLNVLADLIALTVGWPRRYLECIE
jgi:hypothetical protein